MTARIAVRRYTLELGSALLVYTLTLVAALHFEPTLSPGAFRFAVMVSPALGVILAVWAIVRHQLRVDEYVRLVTLQNIAISAAVTAGWTLTYGFLENAGLPRLSMFTVWPVMGAVWGTLAVVRGICR